jgi:hypothetical protein
MGDFEFCYFGKILGFYGREVRTHQDNRYSTDYSNQIFGYDKGENLVRISTRVAMTSRVDEIYQEDQYPRGQWDLKLILDNLPTLNGERIIRAVDFAGNSDIEPTWPNGVGIEFKLSTGPGRFRMLRVYYPAFLPLNTWKLNYSLFSDIDFLGKHSVTAQVLNALMSERAPKFASVWTTPLEETGGFEKDSSSAGGHVNSKAGQIMDKYFVWFNRALKSERPIRDILINEAERIIKLEGGIDNFPPFIRHLQEKDQVDFVSAVVGIYGDGKFLNNEGNYSEIIGTDMDQGDQWRELLISSIEGWSAFATFMPNQHHLGVHFSRLVGIGWLAHGETSPYNLFESLSYAFYPLHKMRDGGSIAALVDETFEKDDGFRYVKKKSEIRGRKTMVGADSTRSQSLLGTERNKMIVVGGGIALASLAVCLYLKMSPKRDVRR